MSNNDLSQAKPCFKCEKLPSKIEVARPEGRQQDIYRVVCECGNGPAQWSVSEAAAVRLWNVHSAL